MASILCPSCHKLISEDAESCIHCGQRKPGLWGATAAARKLGLRIDFSNVIVGLCIGLYVLGLALDPGALFNNFSNPLQFLSPSMEASFKLGMTGSQPIFGYGLWWTPVTAIYLHGGLIHIFFNTMWIRQLGPLVEELFGPFRFIIIFTVAGIVGFIASALFGSAFTLGASGSIFGLLAAAIAYGRRVGSSLFTRQFMQWAGLIFFMGFIMPGVDNWAHGGGFVGGYLTAWLLGRSMSREGVGAYLGAGLCALATVGAFTLQLLAVWGLY